MADRRFITVDEFEAFAKGIGSDIGRQHRLLEALIQRGDLSLLQEIELLSHRVSALEAGHRAGGEALTAAQQSVLKAKLRAALGQGLAELAQQQREGDQNSGGTLSVSGSAYGVVTNPPAADRADG
jgi:hypothetical protein